MPGSEERTVSLVVNHQISEKNSEIEKIRRSEILRSSLQLFFPIFPIWKFPGKNKKVTRNDFFLKSVIIFFFAPRLFFISTFCVKKYLLIFGGENNSVQTCLLLILLHEKSFFDNNFQRILSSFCPRYKREYF